MAKKKTDERPEPEAMSYEEAIAELEAINQRIERGEIGLEESLAEYKRGVALAQRCGSILDAAEQELKKVKPDDTETTKSATADLPKARRPNL